MSQKIVPENLDELDSLLRMSVRVSSNTGPRGKKIFEVGVYFGKEESERKFISQQGFSEGNHQDL